MDNTTINSYCVAIRNLIIKAYFSQHRKIFLAFDTVAEYSNAIKPFMEIPEIQKINEIWHNCYSAALKEYINFLMEMCNVNPHEIQIGDESKTQQEFEIDEVEEHHENIEVEKKSEDETDWEATFTNAQGKLTRIANPELIDKLRPYLDTEYKSTATAYNIVEDFYGDRFKSMEIKDWQKLFDNIDWNAPYYLPSTVAEPEGKRKTHILKVVFPDGTEIMEKRVSETLVKVVQFAGVENVRSLNISICGANMIVEEYEINPRYKAATKLIENGLYVNTCSDTPTKALIIRQISDNLKLGLTIEFVSIIDDDQIPQAPSIPYPILSTREKVRVTFPDGRIIQYARVLQTLIDVIEYAGIERVKELNIIINRSNLITDTVTPTYEVSLKQLSNGMYVHTNSSTQTKFAQIQQISDDLHLGLNVELV